MSVIEHSATPIGTLGHMPPPKTSDPVTQAEIAIRCHTTPAIVRQWSFHGKLPEPDYVSGSTKLWAWETLSKVGFIAELTGGPITFPGLTIEEAAEDLGVSAVTVRRMVDDGRLGAEKAKARGSGRISWAVDPDSVAAVKDAR